MVFTSIITKHFLINNHYTKRNYASVFMKFEKRK